MISINANYVVAINNKYCGVWHEKRLAAEANEAEGPDADGLPTSWWETLILRPQQTGRPCLDKWFSSALALRQQGCGAVAPVCPQAGGWGGPWFCQNGARQTTRWPRRWSSPTSAQERRVSPCVHKQLDARTLVSDWHIQGLWGLHVGRKGPRADGGALSRPSVRQKHRNMCRGALKEDTNFIEECVPLSPPEPPTIPHLGPSLSWEIIGRARSRG